MKAQIFILFLVCVSQISYSIQLTPQNDKKNTIIESNHYFSDYERGTTYTVNKVKTDRPLIYILKQSGFKNKFQNKLTIGLVSGSNSNTCIIDNIHGLCYLDNPPSTDLKMKISCQHLPCEASWTILQPSISALKSTENVKELYDISESDNHMMAVFSCNNPEVKDFSDRFAVYSEDTYIKGLTKNLVYYLFPKQKKGHMYIDMGKLARTCAFMAIYQVPSSLQETVTYRDFVMENSTSIFKLGYRPNKQFMLSMSMHQLDKSTITSVLNISLIGQKSGQKQMISSVNVKPEGNLDTYDFNVAYKKVHEDYSNLYFELKSSDKIIIINFELIVKDKIEMEITQHSYFSLKNGEVLQYKLKAEDEAASSDKVAFYPSDTDKIKIGAKQCFLKEGCQFTLLASQTVTGNLYAGKNTQEKKEGQINFNTLTTSVTSKIHQGDQLYYKKSVKKGKAFQTVVNTPNVILYAAPSEQCETPTSKCYEKIANMHNPFIYEPKEDLELRFMVRGLDNSEFTITIIDEGTDSIPLNDGQPFSYLMDDKEEQLLFSFSLSQTNPVSFNLISPINDLVLVVKNSKKQPREDTDLVSSQGFISFSKKQITGNQFRILVKKTEEGTNKFVHFTLIATTSEANMRLQPAVSHYETIKKDQSRSFVFEFDTDQDYLVNFYIHNIPDSDVSLPLLVTGSTGWTSTNVQSFTIDHSTDILNLKDVSEELCETQGEVTCQIFIKIVNKMIVEVDITITLLVKESVIELKDGLWQTFSINTIAESSHFYFFPKNSQKSVGIMYKSDLVDVQVIYNMWKSDSKNINPSQWPFPTISKTQEKTHNNLYQPIKHISIDSSALKACAPSCIVLVSISRIKSQVSDALAGLQSAGVSNTFSIMATNQLIEIPEKTKLDIFLKEDEEKYLLVDLKYAMERQALTFFTSTILGYYNLYGNVYSQSNPRCPEPFESDFSFGIIQTQIKIKSVMKKLQENEMQDDNNIYLCLLATSYMDSKFTIQYTSQQSIIKLLNMNSFEQIQLNSGEVKMFQMQADQEYELKFTREKGYFYASFVVCKKGEDYEECLEDFQDKDDKGKQIITKTQQFGQKPCQDCIIFVKLSSDQPAQLLLHVQSKYSIIQLKENDVVSDFTNQNQQNKYSITTLQDEETIINIDITDGYPVVVVRDAGTLIITKQKNPSTGMIHIVIPAVQAQKDDSIHPLALGGAYSDSFSLSSTFRYLQISVKSKNQKLPTAYTITYSSGERQTYLEDGLMTGYSLEKDKKSTFFYNNPNKASHGFVTISMPKSAVLYRMKLQMYYYTDPNDEDTKVEFTPEKPPMRKNTPNPTVTYSIPAERKVSIEMVADEETKVSLIVNHQQLIILPFQQEFPFYLHKGEDINLLTDVNNPGYLMVSVRKCDQSAPELGYTFDYDSFQKSEFEYETTLEDQPRFQYMIKANKIGSLYMNIRTPAQNSILAITIHYSDTKISADKNKAGNGGVVTYEIKDSKTAKVTFTGVTCTKSKCDKDISYYWLSSTSMQEVYTQTVCPYSYFSMLDIKSDHPITMTKITSSPSFQNKIEFEYPLLDHISYLSVKAKVGEQEIYYQPTEIITMWGSLSRSSSHFNMGLIFTFFCIGCIGLVTVRRIIKWLQKKKQQVQYIPVDQFD